MASLQVSAGSRAQQSATEEADSTTEAAATKRLRLMDEFEDEDSEWEGELLSSVMQYLSPTEKPAADLLEKQQVCRWLHWHVAT